MARPILSDKLRTALAAAFAAALCAFLGEVALERAVVQIWDTEVSEYLPAILSSVALGLLVFLLMWREVARRLEREEAHWRAQAQLQAAYDALEERVRDRTSGLSESNAALQAEIVERINMEKDLVALLAENARLHSEAQRALALEERQRLSRDLHDSLSQTLYGISLGAQGAREAVETGTGDAIATLDYVVSLTQTALADMRAIIRELRPETLERDGLVAAIAAHVEALCERNPIEAKAELGGEPNLSLDTKEALYRIAVEALNNTIRHSQATVAEIRLNCHNDAITLEVCDNGRGFESAGPVPGHLGLLSMHERAAELGGSLDIESFPGRGTCVRARIPAGPVPAGAVLA